MLLVCRAVCTQALACPKQAPKAPCMVAGNRSFATTALGMDPAGRCAVMLPGCQPCQQQTRIGELHGAVLEVRPDLLLVCRSLLH